MKKRIHTFQEERKYIINCGDDVLFKYNVCFLKSEDRILMLNREKAPIMGVWNGVGGKNEVGENPEKVFSIGNKWIGY